MLQSLKKLFKRNNSLLFAMPSPSIEEGYGLKLDLHNPQTILLTGNRKDIKREKIQLQYLSSQKKVKMRGLFTKRYYFPIDLLDSIQTLFPRIYIDEKIVMASKCHALYYLSSKITDSDEDGLGLPQMAINLYPFQKVAVKYAREAKRCILGDEAGVGKTFPSIAFAKTVVVGSVIVICPGNLKLNWESEIKRAFPDDTIHICYGRKSGPLPKTNWIIVNYDIATNWVEDINNVLSNVVILDEIHNCKNSSTKKAKACHQIVRGKEYRVGLTGTLFRNNLLEARNPLAIINQYSQMETNADILGLPPLEDLEDGQDGNQFNKLLRSTCYMRREKRDVLTQLPKKTRSLTPVELGDSALASYKKSERELISWLKSKMINSQLSPQLIDRAEALSKLNTMRQQVGIGKIEIAKEWIENFLEESEEKLVVFAYHREVQESLVRHFPDALAILGSTSLINRHLAVTRFQKDPLKRLIICSLYASSEGITLTAASSLLCVELDYVPARLFDQMEGRIDRLGQNNPMNIYYLLAKDSLDMRIMNLIEKKWNLVKSGNIGAGEVGNLSIFDDLLDIYSQD